MRDVGGWPVPRRLPRLEAGEVHVWLSTLVPGDAEWLALSAALDAAEHARAARFRFARHRRQFVVARGTLRQIVGRYADLPPEEVALVYGPRGKPYLAGPRGPRDVRFNLSHSGDLLLLAVAAGREVGVDVERIRADIVDDAMARTSFSAREVAAFRALPRAERVRGFFDCWSRKEAFIKATGEGVSYGLQAFDVSLGPTEEPRLLASRRDPMLAVRWTLRALPPLPGYAAALVAGGRGFAVRCFRWPSAWTLPSLAPARIAVAAGAHGPELHV
jgi:4'-phosphopantetheinyl transferase